MTTRYKQTPLPGKLDLNRYDTKQQLSEVIEPKESSPIHVQILQKSKDQETQEEINKLFSDVIVKDLQKFISINEVMLLDDPITPSHNSETLFKQWVRQFHSEYDDSWFSKNYPRLIKAFQPVCFSLAYLN